MTVLVQLFVDIKKIELYACNGQYNIQILPVALCGCEMFSHLKGKTDSDDMKIVLKRVYVAMAGRMVVVHADS